MGNKIETESFSAFVIVSFWIELLPEEQTLFKLSKNKFWFRSWHCEKMHLKIGKNTKFTYFDNSKSIRKYACRKNF